MSVRRASAELHVTMMNEEFIMLLRNVTVNAMDIQRGVVKDILKVLYQHNGIKIETVTFSVFCTFLGQENGNVCLHIAAL